MKRTNWFALLLVVAAAIVLTSPILAFNGGVTNSDRQISCDNGKHSGGSATITMAGSPMNPTAGETVSVWVNVSGAITGGRLGVIITSSLQGSASLPSNDGWAIVSDPSGTAFNFNQKTSASAGVNSFKWTLTAPASGTHTLYSKAFYAGPAGNTYTAGLAFSVGGGGGGGGGSQSNTSVTITNPIAGISVVGTVNINTNLVSPAGISYAVLRIDGTVISNLTAAPYAWTWNTALYSDGTHIINVTAAGNDGSFGYAQRTVIVSNVAAQTLDQTAWQWTIIALTLSSIAAISVVAVMILMFKKRRMGGGS
jgi:hypothetical protein